MKFCDCGKKISFTSALDICGLCQAKQIWQATPKHIQLKKWGVPIKTINQFLKLDIAQFNKSESRFNKSLYLHGEAGLGKTTTAIAQMIYNAEQYYTSEENANPKAELFFITMPELLFKLRQTYNKPINHDTFETAEEMAVNFYRNVDVLVLDDFGVEKITDWVSTILYLILTYRYENDRVTIFTSNLSLDELTVQLKDARLTSRIGGWCDLVEFKGNDRRKKTNTRNDRA